MESKEQVIFHGGCHGCTMQSKKGLGYCTGCQYFEGNWSFPNLNDKQNREREELEEKRDEARKQANLK